MKIVAMASVLVLASGAFAAEKTMTTTTTTPAVVSTSSTGALAHNTLAFNFVGMSQGKTNIYFDVGGMSERVTPALSFRTYSNKEVRKNLNDNKLTVDRSLATLGASIAVVKSDNKSVILNPYLYFGTEKDMTNTDTKNGIGLRLVGQVGLNKTMAIQAGIDGNNIEDTFKSDVYVGLAFAL